MPNHENQIRKLVKIINSEKPDIIIFTGDMVNSISSEVKPFIPELKHLKSKYGNYAILGNHDYGDYYFWKNQEAQNIDHKRLLDNIKASGFILLLNENKIIISRKDTIFIAGIENWGKKPYRELGDLTLALKGIGSNKFVMLLSHDPVFWDEFVKNKNLVNITFSGHTHGVRFGFKIGKYEFNPFNLPFKYTSGLYSSDNEYLYVNKGLGGSIYPGRAIIRPEISVFVLKSE
jgi:predicted MPP superfamily phosphohydrolase